MRVPVYVCVVLFLWCGWWLLLLRLSLVLFVVCVVGYFLDLFFLYVTVCFPTYILTIAYHILAIKVVVQFVVCCVSSLVSTYVDTYSHCYSIAYFSHVYSTVVIRYMFVEYGNRAHEKTYSTHYSIQCYLRILVESVVCHGSSCDG